ncbi:glycosyl transferase [Geobacter pickeringii]|uniref:Glycosyl transferase n=1 Tax=Geobacter pickeringii TaxID=345632 RepID=A0A0B5BEQ7_9BACT|nr:glycosyl transferase [Geobacter pickeringii]
MGHHCCAAVVILYHPQRDYLDNIRTWIEQVDAVYVVDNSESPDLTIAEHLSVLPGVTYLAQGENRGVAYGLNLGARKAIEAGYDYLLTMDQDSRASGALVKTMFECLDASAATVGIISPFHLTRAVRQRPSGATCSDVMTPMTSGCLLNLSAWRCIGPFREDFFIDFVDDEFCLRLRRNGYQVLQANAALLEHEVGNVTRFGPFIATNHSPLRRYYKTRNRFAVFAEYRRDFPGHCLFDLVRLAKEAASIVLFEREKGAKLRMMWRGWRDFRRGKFGKFEGGSR